MPPDSHILRIRTDSSHAPKLITKENHDQDDTRCLVDFKAHSLVLDGPSSTIRDPLRAKEVLIKSADATRSEARYRRKGVWVEWKKYRREPSRHSDWNQIVEHHVKDLAMLLASCNKPIFEHRIASVPLMIRSMVAGAGATVSFTKGPSVYPVQPSRFHS